MTVSTNYRHSISIPK